MTDRDRSLALGVDIYLACFGSAAPPDTADELLEKAEVLGPFVQNPLAEVLHDVDYPTFLEALRRRRGEA